MEIVCGDDPAAWARLGFTVGPGGAVPLPPAVVRVDGRGGGLRGWALGGGPAAGAPAHANGAMALDHVVLRTADLDRAVAGLVAAGGSERRRAAPPDVPVPMAFVRVDGAIVEVAAAEGPDALWGLVAVVADLDALAVRLGPLLGDARAAVQSGRRIATVRPAAGLQTALAFMSPRPPRRGRAGSNPAGMERT